MIAALLLGVAPLGMQATAPADLLAVFKTVCMQGDKTLGAPNTAALPRGFVPASLGSFEIPAGVARETAAWERDGVRISRISMQTDTRLFAGAICMVKANVGRLGRDMAFIDPVGEAVGALFGSGHNIGGKHPQWNLMTGSGMVQIFIDKTKPARVVVTILSDAGAPEKGQ
jgi:hypothetical protein